MSRLYAVKIRVVRYDGVDFNVNYDYLASSEWRAKIHAHSVAEKYRAENRRAEIVSIVDITR